MEAAWTHPYDTETLLFSTTSDAVAVQAGLVSASTLQVDRGPVGESQLSASASRSVHPYHREGIEPDSSVAVTALGEAYQLIKFDATDGFDMVTVTPTGAIYGVSTERRFLDQAVGSLSEVPPLDLVGLTDSSSGVILNVHVGTSDASPHELVDLGRIVSLQDRAWVAVGNFDGAGRDEILVVPATGITGALACYYVRNNGASQQCLSACGETCSF